MNAKIRLIWCPPHFSLHCSLNLSLNYDRKQYERWTVAALDHLFKMFDQKCFLNRVNDDRKCQWFDCRRGIYKKDLNLTWINLQRRLAYDSKQGPKYQIVNMISILHRLTVQEGSQTFRRWINSLQYFSVVESLSED